MTADVIQFRAGCGGWRVALHQQKERQDQPWVGVPGPGHAPLAPQGLPIAPLRIDVEAGFRTSNAGADVLALRADCATHGLGRLCGAADVGLGAQQTAWTAEDLLGWRKGTEVLTEGLASIGPAADQCGQQSCGTQHGQNQAVAVGDEQPQAQATDQQAPLQLNVVACQPGRFANRCHLRFTGPIQHSSLPTQGPEELGNKRQWTDPPPEFMAQHNGQDHQRKADIPEKIVTNPWPAQRCICADSGSIRGC